MVTRLPQPRRNLNRRIRRERRRLGRFVAFSEMQANLTPVRLIEPSATTQGPNLSKPSQQR
jgi:hypothetical protein